jgi:hypothetical protein
MKRVPVILALLYCFVFPPLAGYKIKSSNLPAKEYASHQICSRHRCLTRLDQAGVDELFDTKKPSRSRSCRSSWSSRTTTTLRHINEGDISLIQEDGSQVPPIPLT